MERRAPVSFGITAASTDTGGSNHHVRDVGRIIMDVEKELADLRDSLSGALGHVGNDGTTAGRVELIIRKAEKELHKKAELVLNASMTANIERMPMVAGMDTSDEITVRTHSQRHTLSKQQQYAAAERKVDELVHMAASHNNMLSRSISEHESTAANAAQEQQRAMRLQQARQRPRPSSVSYVKRSSSEPGDLWANGKDGFESSNNGVVENQKLSILELENRRLVSPNADVPGILTSGLTPLLIQNRAPMYKLCNNVEQRKHQVCLLGDGQDPSIRFDMNNINGQLVTDVRHQAQSVRFPRPRHNSAGEVATELPRSIVGSTHGSDAIVDHDEQQQTQRKKRDRRHPKSPYSPPQQLEEESLGKTVERIHAYENVVYQHDLYVFIIRDGKTASRSTEFITFRKKFKFCWGAIAALVDKVEKLFTSFSVPLAYVDGQKLALLANDELAKPSVDNIMACVRNHDQVNALINFPGRRFASKSHEALDHAATAIQSTVRAHQTRAAYLNGLRKTFAAKCIQLRFRVHSLQRKLAIRLEAQRADDEAKWAGIQLRLSNEWGIWQASKRVIVHVPSRSFAEQMRMPVERLKLLENLQMARIADLADPNVTVVYVVPFAVPHEVIVYYEKLLTVAGVPGAQNRLVFVCPENTGRFPEHFALSTVLYYSPRAIKRIRRICGTGPGDGSSSGINAYIVPGQVGEEDKTLAMVLGVPLMGPTPELAAFYGSKSGTKRLFAEARVSLPPGAHDLYEYYDVISTLAKLVVANLNVPQWLLKIDDEHSGRGHALVNIGRLPIVTELRRERKRQTAESDLKKAYWSHSEVQEAASAKLEAALKVSLRDICIICAGDLYPTWNRYFTRFVKVGGVIEAVPDNVVGSPSVNLCVEPDGCIKLISMQDQIFGRCNQFQYVGASFPQQSCPHSALRQAATTVARALHKNGVFGYVGVDFVVSHDRNVNALRLWAVDINLRMTNSCAAFKLFNFLMGGKGMDERAGTYFARIQPKESNDKKRKTSSIASCSSSFQISDSRAASSLSSGSSGSRSSADGETSLGTETVAKISSSSKAASVLELRSYVVFDTLSHPNLSSSSYGTFFNICRLHGVSFNLHLMKGTVFNLYDSLGSGLIGAMSIAPNGKDARMQMYRSLAFIHSQAGGFVSKQRKGTADSAEDNNNTMPHWEGTCSFLDALAIAKAWTGLDS